MAIGGKIIAGRRICTCKGPVAEESRKTIAMAGIERAGRGRVVCRGSLGPEGFLNQKRELVHKKNPWRVFRVT